MRVSISCNSSKTVKVTAGFPMVTRKRVSLLDNGSAANAEEKRHCPLSDAKDWMTSALCGTLAKAEGLRLKSDLQITGARVGQQHSIQRLV
jgi:hypothetical protein